MNGEPLPTRHGFPARLVVPGLYGYVSATKWLSAIELTRFDQFEGYWVPRGWAALAPVKTQSRIDRPGGRIVSGRTAVAGVAWAPTRGISTVEVRVDEEPWRTATLGPSVGDDSWRQWWIDWDASPGRHALTCRATDGGGEVQTEARSRPDPDGATGWHTITVTVDS
jgi:DMSO/TMAO reductase YedYZ molybdopterin-dependent catalytic subunit